MNRVNRVTIMTVLAALLVLPPAALAQVSKLDKLTFIEGLRKEEMGELLLHLLDTEPPDNPVLVRQVTINQLLLDYRQKMRDSGGDPAVVAEAVGAFNRALDEYRALIREFNDDEQRPLWQADLAELLLTEYLPGIHQNAAEFTDLGVPTVEQRQAFESAAAETVEQLTDADLRMGRLQGDLPREADHEEKRVNTGLWSRMIDDYQRLRIPFFLGQASYNAALLPDSHPYYQSLGKNKFIPAQRQKKTAAEERARLLNQAIDQLDPFATDVPDAKGVRAPALLTTGLAQLRLGNTGDAIATFDTLQAMGIANQVDLASRLGEAVALNADNNFDGALAELETAQRHILAQQNLLMRLLVVDVEHRLRLARAAAASADQKAALLEEAYAPYLKFLDDPAVGEAREGLKGYIFARWQANVAADTRPEDLPAVVVMAIAEVELGKGQQLALAEADDDAAAAANMTAALVHLNRSIELNQGLLKREGLANTVRGPAMMNLALATYFSGRDDTENLYKAADTLTDLADAMPEEKIGETAIGYAVDLLVNLHAQTPRPAGVGEHFERTMKVLIAKYGSSKKADDNRLYYAMQVLYPAEKYTEMADVLERVPFQHPDYFRSRQERLFALFRLARTKGEDQAAAVEKATLAAKELRTETEAALATADPELRPAIEGAAGESRLVQAELAIDAGLTDEALSHLQNFETDFAGNDDLHADLVRRGLSLRIIAYAKAGRYDDAAKDAKAMMNAYPDDAAAVVDQVIDQLVALIDRLNEQAANELVDRKKQELLDQAKGAARTVQTLASLLMDWAITQNYTDEQMLPYQMIRARAMTLAGDGAGAVAFLEPLHEKYDTEVEVIHAMAEAYFAQGGQDVLINKAAPLYNQLIQGIPGENGKYPPMYWNAYMRAFQICEKVDQETENITSTVRQLELVDGNLGGEPYKSELKRLENKYAGGGAAAPKTAPVPGPAPVLSMPEPAKPESGGSAAMPVILGAAVLSLAGGVAWHLRHRRHARR